MRKLQDSLIHEAASLFRLVDSIDRFVAEQRYRYTYTDGTQSFFKHVRKFAEATRKQVSDIVQQSAKRPGEIETRHRPALIIQKDRWRTLHTYIKPASDAHTLMLPTPLLELATAQLRQVKGMEGREIVLLLTPDLMYYYNGPESSLSNDLVFVELPYTQGPSLFTNLTIYHEIGHYVYEKLTSGELECMSFNELMKTMEERFEKALGSKIKTAPNRAWAKKVFDDWATEIFCDLFAIRLLGPAFSFALIDFLSLIGLMKNGEELAFRNEHPAPALRLREQVRCLRRDGWWEHVAALPSGHVLLLLDLESRDVSKYRFVNNNNDSIPGFTDTFESILPSIYAVVDEIIPASPNTALDFSRRRVEIEECLFNGVVPSKLLEVSHPKSPSPVSMINAAYCFYLTRLPELMESLEDQYPTNLDQRRIWIERLEAWTLKGIEDYDLLTTSVEGL